MSDREPLSVVMARLEDRLRPHASAPVTARRKATDSPAPNGLAAGYGTRKNTNASARSLRGNRPPYAGYFRPDAAYFANNPVPAMARPTVPGVKPVGRRKIGGPATVLYKGKRIPSAALNRARADSEFAEKQRWVSTRGNLQRDAGDMPGQGSTLNRDDRATYPRRMSDRSDNVGPAAIYGRPKPKRKR